MTRIAVLLAAIAQVPLATASAEVPTANRVLHAKCQVANQTSAAPIQGSQRADYSAPARGTMDLGLIDKAIRYEPTNVPWNDLAPSRSMWASFEYLGVWVKGSRVPSPSTRGTIATPLLQDGLHGQNGGASLSGDQRLDAGMQSGERITAGAWLKGNEIGVEASFFSLQPESTHFSKAVGTR
jgi:hypothetical protein